MIRGAGALALLIGVVALALPSHLLGARPTWETLLAPYSTGAPLPQGFRVEGIHRGPDNGVVVSVRRPDDGAAVEVLVVERGRWKSVQESRSFTIDYELPRSSAAEREAVTAFVAATIRSRDTGLPAPDAIPLGADDGTVLPWWLAMLRGTRGMLLGASLVVLGLLVLLRSPGLACAGLVLGVSALAARFVGVPPLRPDVGAVWTVPATVGLLLVALRGRRSRPRSAVSALVAVAAVALVLRLALGPWGPLHVNGHGPRFVAGAVGHPGDIASYGPGYHEIFAPVAALAPASPDWAIFACNALFSGLVAPLAFAIARMAGLAANVAFVAAFLLAIDPIAIRTGATEGYFAPIAFFGTAAGAVMLLALREMEAGGRARAGALLVAAGLLLALAARIHPCAWVLVATVPFVVLAADAGSPGRRLVSMLAAAAVAGGVLVCTSATALLDVLGHIRTGTVLRPDLPSPWPLVWVALLAALYAVVAPRRGLAVPAAIALAAMLLTRHAFDATWIWTQSYLRLYLTWPVLAALACVPPAWLRRRRLVASAAAALVVAWLGLGWPIVAGRTTEHLEYRWVREELLRLPPECRVVHLAFAGRRVLLLPTYVGPARTAVAMRAREAHTAEAAFAPGECVYYVRSSLCSTVEGRPECDAIERRLTLRPIARASFPETTGERETFGHDGDAVETTIARVEAVAEPGRR
jgi:hypothetical protein